MNLLENEITDSAVLLELIPQRMPFVMVDSLVHYSDTKIVSQFTILEKNVLINEQHFSAAGLIENMAQTIALHTGYKYYLKNQPAPKGYIGAIKKATIFNLPKVEQQLTTTVEILHDIMGITLVEAKVESEGKLIASSQMKTALAK
jgi:predicted hotdog family 3-hydroxylacyl-ACP dehydratase